MPDSIKRRVVLSGLVTPFLALPVLARPPFRLLKDPQPLLSPPILDEAGTTRKLDYFAGRIVLLNIWATWCPPCRAEMPSLDRLEGNLGGADFSVVPLCIDAEGIGPGRKFYDELGIVNLPLYWAEPSRVQLALAFFGLPTTLLIDRQGREIGRLQGPFAWDSGGSIRQLRNLIDGSN